MTDTALMWRREMAKYEICSDDASVNVSYGDCDYVSSFLNVFVDSKTTPSPFKNIDDAELFAEIMVKLLKVISDDIK